MGDDGGGQHPHQPVRAAGERVRAGAGIVMLRDVAADFRK